MFIFSIFIKYKEDLCNDHLHDNSISIVDFFEPILIQKKKRNKQKNLIRIISLS